MGNVGFLDEGSDYRAFADSLCAVMSNEQNICPGFYLPSPTSRIRTSLRIAYDTELGM